MVIDILGYFYFFIYFYFIYFKRLKNRETARKKKRYHLNIIARYFHGLLKYEWDLEKRAIDFGVLENGNFGPNPILERPQNSKRTNDSIADISPMHIKNLLYQISEFARGAI